MLPRPRLEGSRLTLRPLQPTDLDVYLALLQDAESLRLTGTQRSFSRDDAAGWLASLASHPDRLDLAIILRDANDLIGEVVLNQIDAVNRSANIRIGLRTPYTNHGYGREAMRLMMHYAFTQQNLHRLELEVYLFNPRAIHLYQQLGFQQEGRRRDVLYMDGAFHDTLEMSILEDEYWTVEAAQRKA